MSATASPVTRISVSLTKPANDMVQEEITKRVHHLSKGIANVAFEEGGTRLLFDAPADHADDLAARAADARDDGGHRIDVRGHVQRWLRRTREGGQAPLERRPGAKLTARGRVPPPSRPGRTDEPGRAYATVAVRRGEAVR